MRRMKTYTKLKEAGLVYRIMKSSFLNILMLLIGFIIGAGSVMFHYSKLASRNSNYEFIQKVDEKLDEFDKLDDRYDALQKEIKDLINEGQVKLVKDHMK